MMRKRRGMVERETGRKFGKEGREGRAGASLFISLLLCDRREDEEGEEEVHSDFRPISHNSMCPAGLF